MKKLILIAALATYSGVMFGCQSDDNSGPQHQQVQERTVTDPNGNVISHTESKTDSSNNNSNNSNP